MLSKFHLNIGYKKIFSLKTNVKKAPELWCRFVKGKYYKYACIFRHYNLKSKNINPDNYIN
jgi:hypothetical protein